MIILPAIDIIGGKAVRLLKGDYAKMTVYSEDPCAVAADFKNCGAEYIHLVDLEGARDGNTPNLELISRIIRTSGLFAEVGGGIRTPDTVKAYVNAGVGRVILGTAALRDREFLREMLSLYGEKIAVGADIKDGFVAVKGWTESSERQCGDFCREMREEGVKNLIVTDISRDGAMRGTNLELYRELSQKFDIDITASGGVSSLEDIRALREMELYGAIIGKAYYTGAIDLKTAVEVAK